ncbi:MAG TPA: response regulator transcription factor [Actinocrinis sp.]|uniref:response regulator transcription factor n=1 Tax=Actinocrinis sp. TaxID=1920516 RepID=UPI002DDD9725|nr:response regulator transcription factor [Actinocrinis sp.]HEV2347687.1 response regulator transcription factor [Actinocrinis sp.]
MSDAPVSVLVVDDHPTVVEGVKTMLEGVAWLHVVGYARNGRTAITAAEMLRPDVVLLDLRLPDMLGPEVIRALRARAPQAKVVLFTAFPEHASLEPALAAGADGAVVKVVEQYDLVDVIRRVVRGERVVQITGEGALLDRRLQEHGLTSREYEILRRVAMGETNPEIAVNLALTRNTVKTYLQRAMEKLGAHNRVEAISRASQLGIL